MMSKQWLLAGIVLTACLGVTAGIGPDQAQLAKVASGEVTEARLSWWGFNEDDSTAIIAEAIASKASTLVVDKMPLPWVTLPVRLKSDFTLKFEDGAEIQAKKGAFKGLNDSLVTVDMLHNVRIIGEGKGGVLRMHKADYQGLDYRHGEWRMGICILSSDNVLVENMSIVETGGDGIYIGVNSDKSEQHYSKDVVIRKCNCDRNHRQGISVIAAVNLLIEDTRLTNTSGTPPASGIDFEPNKADEPLINCIMRNCYSENNQGCGYEFYLPQQDSRKCGRDSFVIENCVSKNERKDGFRFTVTNWKDKPDEQPWEGDLLVKDCVFSEAGDANISFTMDCWQKLEARLENCEAISSGSVGKPVSVAYRRKSKKGGNGVRIAFKDMVLRGSNLEQPVNVSDRILLGCKQYGIEGDITVHAAGKAPEKYIYNADTLPRLFPGCDYGKLEAYDYAHASLVPGDTGKGVSLPGGKIRHAANFWLYLTAGKEASFTLRYAQLVKNKGVSAPVELIGASGKHYPLGTIDFLQTRQFTVTAPEGTGFYKVVFQNGNNWTTLTNCTVPAGLLLDDEKGLNMIYMTGTYYMYVPDTVETAVICFTGDGNREGAKITIKDPQGKVRFSGDNVVSKQFAMSGKADAGIWSFTVEPPTRISHEDLCINIFGMPPYITMAPSAVPVLSRGK